MASDVARGRFESSPAFTDDAVRRWESTQVREPEDNDELIDWYLGVLEADA